MPENPRTQPWTDEQGRVHLPTEVVIDPLINPAASGFDYKEADYQAYKQGRRMAAQKEKRSIMRFFETLVWAVITVLACIGLHCVINNWSDLTSRFSSLSYDKGCATETSRGYDWHGTAIFTLNPC